MNYSEFEAIISPIRMRRYVTSCNSDTGKAMKLYRYNIRLSKELLAVVGCFEVALRNKINTQFLHQFGNNWLRDFILDDGVFSSDHRVAKTKGIIKNVYDRLFRTDSYSHDKLISEMEFGVWKYMFSNVQYSLTGQTLLSIFPNKPRSTPTQQYDNTYIFQELDFINNLRNRIAHHEPICFGNEENRETIDTSYAINRYQRIMRLFEWLDIDGPSLLRGVDNVIRVTKKIQSLQISHR